MTLDIYLYNYLYIVLVIVGISRFVLFFEDQTI